MEVSDHRYRKTAICILTVCGWGNNLSHNLLSQIKFGVCDFDVVTSMSLPLHIFIKMKASKFMPIKKYQNVCELL